MAVDLAARVAAASAAHPKPPSFKPSYGTAGFRATADLLPSTLFRCGLLMAARSAALGGAPVGLCVTASHNPPCDTGVKLVDPSGHMLAAEWEPLADRLANAADDAAVAALVVDALAAAPAPAGTVWIAHDTRPSSPPLAAAAAAGVAAAGGAVRTVGTATTPQLHWLVAAAARGREATLDAYYKELAAGHAALVRAAPPLTPPAPASPLVVDAANGVGAAAVIALGALTAGAGLGFEVRNGDAAAAEKLNHRCGSDHVQKTRAPPVGFDDVPFGTLCASLDGDADRVVYFLMGGDGENVTLFDGDRVAALLARWAAALAASLSPPPDGRGPLTVGAVRTAYANGGAAAAAVAALGPAGARVARTGVKHVHAAATAYDVGLYFEANGHGAVLFSGRFEAAAAAAAGTAAGDAAAAALAASNQAVGDALSALLLVDAALRTLPLSPAGWGALYADLPSRSGVVRVADRTVVAMNNDESAAIAPPALVAAVDAAVAADVVRVYAEAGTQAAADALAAAVEAAVRETCGGV